MEVQQVVGAAQAPALVMNPHRAMLRRAAEETTVFGGKIEKRETATQRQSRQQTQNRNDLYPLHVHPPQILRLKDEVDRINQRRLDQSLHPAAEVHGLQREALAPQVLLEAHIPLTAELGPEARITKAWKKQLIKVRRAKPLGKSAFELGAGPGNQVRE